MILCRIRSANLCTVPPIRLGTFLTLYGVDLTKSALEKKLDPVIGREKVYFFF